MAKIISENDGKEIEVKEGESLKEPCKEKLGIPFACEEGICGSCMIDVLEGGENLSDLTENEVYLGRDKNHRLACQCRIKKGVVKIRF